MKTTKTFRLLAVLLALVLGLGTICTALAEQSVPLDSLTNEQYAEWLKRVQAQNSFENLPVDQQYAYLMALENEEDVEAAIKSLTEEQINAIIAYAQAIEAAKPAPETVVFTKAGPFMPAVNVASMRRSVMRAGTEDSQGDGLNLSKTATAESDGTYKIRLEAYTTGEVTTTTTTVPVDIVLVLDQSGSMADDFNGNETYDNSERRQYAMKKAVNSFIDAVGGKYDETNADHRMAIVTFGTNASTLQGWTKVDSIGANTLKEKISGLPDSPSGATNAEAGMQQAESLMGSGYNYAGTNTKRQKVVVFFTDGVPTTSRTFSTSVANSAITSAKAMKDSGVTVYSIGIFKGANPDQLHGDKWGYLLNSDIPCNGNVGSFWGGYDVDYETPAANRFMNYISTNFPGANNLGAELGEYDPGNNNYSRRGFKITQIFTRKASNYFLTAENADSLDEIFKTISENIQTPAINLDSTTVVKDIVSPYFVPTDAKDIQVYTAAYKGGNTWDDDKVSDLTATITNDTVSVTGFDFNANFVTETLKEDGTRGKKLIIELTVKPKEGFLGGNDVVTNGTDSGIYDKDGKLVKAFVVPTVNVPIKDVTVTAEDKNVYLLGEVTADQLKTGATVKVGDVELDLSKANDADKPYGLETWQTEFVNITVAVKDKNGTAIPTDGLKALTDDTTYTISVTVAPKTTSTTGSAGTPATEKSGENTPAAKINVFKPELTFKDSTVEYKKSVLTLNSQNYDDIKAYFEANNKVSEPIWKHGNTESTGVTMIGNEPTLDLTYTPEAEKIVDNIVESTTDILVKVEVKIDTADVTGNTTFEHQACEPECGWSNDAKNGDPAFLLHVKDVYADLTITKSGAAVNADGTGLDAGQSFLFTVTGPEGYRTEVIIVGNGTVTLKNLKIGEYTVTENTGWSWRYTPTTDNPQTITLEANGTNTVTINNRRDKDQWLDGNTRTDNVFTGTTD